MKRNKVTLWLKSARWQGATPQPVTINRRRYILGDVVPLRVCWSFAEHAVVTGIGFEGSRLVVHLKSQTAPHA